jgi:hypothetical protein
MVVTDEIFLRANKLTLGGGDPVSGNFGLRSKTGYGIA